MLPLQYKLILNSYLMIQYKAKYCFCYSLNIILPNFCLVLVFCEKFKSCLLYFPHYVFVVALPGILKRVGNASLFNIFLLANISSSKWSPHILRLHRDPGSLFIMSFHLQFTAHLLIYCMNSDKNVHVTIVSCIKTFWYKIRPWE